MRSLFAFEKREKQEQHPGFAGAVIVLIICMTILVGGVVVFKVDVAVALFIVTSVVVLYGIKNGIRYKELEKSILGTVSEITNILIYVLLIGALVGELMAAGTIPYLISFGLKQINPLLFLPLTLTMCAIVSLCTGSGISSASTVGVAFIGIAEGMGISLPVTAAAVVCGAYLGDKQSPVSGFTVFTSSICHVNRLKHCKSMLYTTVPAYILSMVIFFVIGYRYANAAVDQNGIKQIIISLDASFKLSPIALIPLIVLIGLIMMKLSPIPTAVIAILSACIVAAVYQGNSLQTVLDTLMNGCSIDSDFQYIRKIANRGGMLSMSSCLMAVMLSVCMGGGMKRTHIIEVAAARIVGAISSSRSLIVGTVLFTILGHYVTGLGLSAAVLTQGIFEEKYEELKVDKTVLSRSIADGGIAISPLVPWCTDAIVCAQALNVTTISYIPYYFMGYLTVVIAIGLGIAGVGVKQTKENNELN